MTIRLFVALCALSLIAAVGCSKKDSDKTEPGSKQAKTASAEGAAAVPAAAGADKPAEPAAAKVSTAGEAAAAAAAPKANLKVENLKVEPVATAKSAVEKPADPKAAGQEEKRIEGPVAMVNGKPIQSKDYYAEVDKILKRSSKIPKERMNRIKENILKRLIEKQLIKDAVAKASIVVPAEAIEKEFAQYKTRFRTDEQFQNYLRHGKVTIESIKARITEKKELELLLEKTGKLAVTDQEVSDFYNKNERFYQEREGVKARHILIKVAENAPKEEEEKARGKLKQAQEALTKGEDFAEVAKRFSEGPSAPKGGDLGFFGRGQMVKPFEDKAFAMKPNEVSEPVRTRFGFHIIQVLEKREARKKTLEEVKDTIAESLRNKKFFQERRSLLNTLKTEAKIERIIKIPKSAGPARKATGHGATIPGHPPIRKANPALARPATAAPKPRVAPRPTVRPAPNPTAAPPVRAPQPKAAPAPAPAAGK